MPHRHDAAASPPVSSVDIVFHGAIRFFQKRISPTDGSRCGFSPTCSVYGGQAIRDQGPFMGLLMTADRMIRCNIWKKAGQDYTILPDGRLYDSPSANVLSSQ